MLLANGMFTEILNWLFGLDKGVLRPGAEWKLGWANQPQMWVLILLIIPAVIGFAFLIYKFEPNVPTPKAVLLGGLRVLAIALILTMIFQPYLYNQITLEQESQVAVLVDTSKSMTFTDRYEDEEIKKKLADVTGLIKENEPVGPEATNTMRNTSRLNLLNMALDNEDLNLLKEMSRDQVLKLYEFSTSLKTASKDQKFEEADESGGTALGDAITETLRKQQGHDTSAIVIFTDGQSNVGSDPLATAKNLSQRGVHIPIYTVAVGNPYKPKDIAVSSVEAPDAAQANSPDPVVFKPVVTSEGLRKGDSKSATLYLKKSNGEPIASKDITLKGNGEEQEETIKWTPKDPGTYQIKVGVNPRPEEVQTRNNEVVHEIKVVDEEIRVFYVEGLPRYEYRFLKNAMIRDKSLKVQILLQSADRTYPQPASPGLKPASHFPRTRKELAKYDVIVIGDVTPGMLRSVGTSSQEVMNKLKAFVDELGGGVLFLSGPSHNPRKFTETPLEPLLPVVVGDAPLPGERKDRRPFRPKLTTMGKQHSAMQLVSSLEENIELWEDNSPNKESLPQPLRWYHPVEKVKLGAQPLAVHPRATSDGDSIPLMAIQRYGRGRSMYVGTDDIWYSMRKIIGDQYYYAFWSQAIRWLRGGRLMGSKRYRLRVEKEEYNPGEKVQVYAHVLNRDYKPAERENITVHIEQKKLNKEVTLDLKKTDSPGDYEGTFRPRELGNFKVWIGSYPTRNQTDDDVEDYAETSFRVVPLDLEGKNPEINKTLLRKIANETGGEFRFLYDVVPHKKESKLQSLADLVYKKPEKVSLQPDREDLWDAPIFLFLFVTILGIEWFVRKRTQLI